MYFQSVTTAKLIFSHRKINCLINPDSVKFLGVMVDPKLSWEQHINYICGKLAKNLFVLRNLSNLVNVNVLLLAYHALISSHMTYAIIIWGHSSHTYRVFKIQRRAIRAITGKGYREDVKSDFVRLKVLTFPCLYIYHSLVYAKTKLPSYLTNGDIHNHATRITDRIRPNYLRLESSRYTANYYGPQFLNKLPTEIVHLPLRQYKYKIKTFLVNKAFYSVNEFFNFTTSVDDFM